MNIFSLITDPDNAVYLTLDKFYKKRIDIIPIFKRLMEKLKHTLYAQDVTIRSFWLIE